MKAAKEARAGLLFASPWFFGFLVFLLYPLCASLYYSFCDYSVLKAPVFIGLDNYTELFKDDVFYTSLYNTLFYALFALPLSTLMALGLAMLLNSKVKGLAFYRTIFFLPSIVPMISLAMLWLWMFNGEFGLVNNGLNAIHLPTQPWLTDKSWTKPALIFMSMWGVGNAMVIYLAGLQNVPQPLYEASDLDGATPWQKTWNVTLPMLSPVIQFNVILGMIGSLQVFAIPYVMFSSGGPERSAYFYAMYLYDNAFNYQRMGYASAMGWIMFIVIFIATRIAIKISDKRVHYETA